MISGEPTLQPQDMYDEWNNPNELGDLIMKKNPWNAPHTWLVNQSTSKVKSMVTVDGAEEL